MLPMAWLRKEGKFPPALLAAFAVVAILLVISVALGVRLFQLEKKLDNQALKVERVAAMATAAGQEAAEALQRASAAEENAALAASGRDQAEAQAARAQVTANQARREAAQSRRDMEKVRNQAETEMDRLHEALGQIAETRRTALGLVMNLGSDALEFDFDKAHLRPENRELLSRIAGILLTSPDYAIYVYGHTDDIGSDSYNMKLSENRARSVRDYLVETGIASQMIETRGFGMTRPLVEGTSPRDRARNRRVEIGIVNTRVQYTDTVNDTNRE